jgi:hypothetical protein
MRHEQPSGLASLGVPIAIVLGAGSMVISLVALQYALNAAGAAASPAPAGAAPAPATVPSPASAPAADAAASPAPAAPAVPASPTRAAAAVPASPSPSAGTAPAPLTQSAVDAMTGREAREALMAVARARRDGSLDQDTRDRLRREFDMLLERVKSAGATP